MELLAISRSKTKANTFAMYYEENCDVYKVEVKSEDVEPILIETLGLIVIEPIPFGTNISISFEEFEIQRTPAE